MRKSISEMVAAAFLARANGTPGCREPDAALQELAY
jgi:hypothetical protein